MKKTSTKILIVAAIVVIAVIVGALIYIWPQRTPVDITLHGAKMTESGEILAEGDITIRGTRIRSHASPAYFEVTALQFVDSKVFTASEEYPSLIVYDSDYLPFAGYSGRINNDEIGDVNIWMELGVSSEWTIEIMPSGSQYCVAELSGPYGDAYYVGCTNEYADLKLILDHYLETHTKEAN